MKKRCMLFFLISFALLSGCASTQNSSRYNSSAVEYLYPDMDQRIQKAGIPHLQLPIKVGVAFVPGNANRAEVLTERDKVVLLEKVGRRFEALEFVHSIEIIPSAYLVPRGSFANLDQIRTMFGTDVIALVSYDQTQFTDEGIASITYWTIVGAYLVPGEKNATHTMVDATVYDIKSRTLLFRAPGVSRLKSTATPINLSEQLRLDRVEAFDMAADDLIVNLEIQLDRFKEKIKQQPEDFRVTQRAGYSGGGFTSGLSALFYVLMAGMGLWVSLRRNR
jgi:rhombotail lipoprotein